MNPRFMVVGILVILLFSAFAMGTQGLVMHENAMEKKSAGDFGKIVEINGVKYTTHDVIRINNNTDFANQAAAEGWPGDGTQSNPYIISGYDIDAHGAGDAIYIGNTTVYFVVENCYLHNASYHSWPYFGGVGITLHNVTNGYIFNNTILDNEKQGIRFRYSKNSTAEGNIIKRTMRGITIEYSSGLVIVNNTVDTIYPTINIVYGIRLYESDYCKIYNNTITNSSDEGLGLYYADKNEIVGNTIYGDGDNGVYVETHNSYNLIDGNIIYNNNGSGIFLRDYSNNNTLKNNTCINNDWGGIYLDLSNYNTLSNNNCSSNGNDGISLWWSYNNTILNNTVNSNGYDGMSLYSSNNNTIFKNIISNNTNYGMDIVSESSYNLIYDNFFYYDYGSGDTYNSSHIQAYDNGTNNHWNSTTGIGNYWYDWANNNNTNDQNRDGIVDWPYLINGSAEARDYYPLKNKSLSNVLSHPMNLTAKVGNGYVNLTWEPPVYGKDTVTQYNIYRDGVLIKIKTVSGNQLWYNDTTVSNGQTYTYYVTAVNSVGESDKSNEVQATPQGAVPEMQVFWLPIIALIFLLGILRKRRERV